LLTLNALVAARSVLVPVQAEFFALAGLAQLTKTVSLVSRVLNRDLRIEGLLLTMVDSRNTLCRDVESEVRAHFGDAVFRTRIPRSVRLSEAPSHALPAFQYAPEGKGTLAYAQAAFEIVERYVLPLDRLAEPFATWRRERADHDSEKQARESLDVEELLP
jgi:chromosome partitioning protein